MYLWCFISDHPRRWASCISWAEYCYNTSYHSSLKTSPFEIVYGRLPPKLLSYCPGLSPLAAVDVELQDRNLLLADVRDRLIQAQQRMKDYYDLHHREVQFQVGDLVLLKLQPYRQLSLANRSNKKLTPKFYGPFPVEAKVGMVAYRLTLPPQTRIHPVFHVSCLRKYHGGVAAVPLLPTIYKGIVQPTPKAILDSRIVSNVEQVLVHWDGLSPAEASWEPVQQLLYRYPPFAHEVTRFLQGVGNVMASVDARPATAVGTQMDAVKIIPFKQVYKRFTHGKKRSNVEKSC